MPATAVFYPSTASGWNSSLNATSLNGLEADSRSDSFSIPTDNLVCSGFGLTAGGHAAIDELYVTVTARGELDGLIYVYLARNGVRLGAPKSDTLTTTTADYTFSGWGLTLSDADMRNLQVVVYCYQLGIGYCYVDAVSAQVTYPATDATPSAFSFGSDLAVPFNTVRTSASATVAGISATAAVNVTNGELEKNGNGAWQTADTTAANGDTFKVRHTSALTGSTSKTTTLMIGGVSAGFTSTTEAADSTPTAFTLDAQTNAELAVSATSNEITVAGINVAASISITGGQYSINGATWTSAAGSVTVGQKVRVKLMTSATYGTLTAATLTIGGVAGAFNVTTKASVGVPTAFDFVNQEAVTVSTLRTSNTITIAGLDAGVNVTIVNGEYSKNGGGWATAPTTCVNGDTFAVRHTSAGAGTQSVITTLIVGNFAESFCSTTAGADITPAAYSFASQFDRGVGRNIISANATITGINVSTPVNVIGGQVSVNGAAYARYGAITTGQTLAVRIDPVHQPGLTKTATIIVGQLSATFTATTTTDYHSATF